MFIKKKYYYGDISDFNPVIDQEIIKKKNDLLKYEENDSNYGKISEYIDRLQSDTKIFKEIEKVMSKDYIYKTDGVVLTQVGLAVGDNDDNKSPKFSGRWYRLFKMETS